MKAHSAQTRPVGIWVRVSTEDQALGDSPQHHEERARQYAKMNGWSVVEVYNLAGVSGKTVMEHPEAQRMLRDLQSGRISALIFSKLARLARNTRELLDFAEIFRRADADMVSLQEKIDTSSPAGRLFYTMIAALTQWEREEIVERVKASIKVRAQLGKTLGGAAPFGYMWKDKKLVVNPTEAPIRRLMFELFAEDKRRKSVARRLNDMGHRTRNGSRFTDTTVMRLLQDPSAKGLYRANHTFRDAKGKLCLKPESEWVHTKVEPIVSEELWNQCNALLEKKAGQRPLGPKPVHLFAGLLDCVCGQRMYVFSRTEKYICGKCRNKIPMADMETAFRSELEAFFVSPDRVNNHIVGRDLVIAQKKELLQSHERKLERVRSEMKRVYQLYVTEAVSPQSFGTLYRPLEEQERALKDELPLLQAEVDHLEIQQASAEDVIKEGTTLRRLWPTFDAPQKRKIIESITEKITVSADEITITFWNQGSCEEFTKGQRNLSGSSPPPK